MNESATRFLRGAGIGLLAAASLSTGCATGAGASGEAQEVRVAAMQTRLEESERMNGRLTARVQELEDQIFLLQDRVDANRIALQRRGVMRGAVEQGVAQAAPRPAPQSYYRGYDYQEPAVQSERNVRRIQLSGGQATDSYQQPQRQAQQRYDTRPEARQVQQAQQQPEQGDSEAEVVIGEKEYREFTGETSSDRSASRSSGTSKTRTAQPGVTDEKLPTTGELEDSASQLERPKTAEQKSAQRDSLSIYKDSLALYRSGAYAEAQKGFQEFLESNPRADYVDNALYWLGECQFGLGDYAGSVGFFERVVREQPDGNKVPDAMLKMSMALEKMGRQDDARRALETLTSQYPATNAAKLGQQKLQGGS